MKKLNLIFLVLTFCCANLFSQHQKKNIFYVHGFTQNSAAAVALGNFIYTDSYFKDIFYPPKHLGYASFGPYGFNYQEPFLTAELDTADNRNWVGVGYSAGGLMARKIIQTQGVTPDPAPADIYFEAFVTITSPNIGTRIASHWDEFSKMSNRRFTSIARGEGTIITSFLHSLTYVIVDGLVSLVKNFQPTISGLSNDMKPNSSFLTGSSGINHSSNLAKEYSLTNGRGFIWGKSNFKWRLASYNDGKSGNDGYQLNIDLAVDERQRHRNWDKKLGKGSLAKRAIQWPSRLWHRMRAGDWSAAIDGFKGLSDDWNKTHDLNNEGSDSFINYNSQIAQGTGTTNSQYREVTDLGTNGIFHGGMIDPGKGMDASLALFWNLKQLGY